MMCHASSTRKIRFLRSGLIHVCSSQTPTIAIRIGIAIELRSMCDRSKTISGASRSMPSVVEPSNMPRRSPSTSRSSTSATSRPQDCTSSTATPSDSTEDRSGLRRVSMMSSSTGWRSRTVATTCPCAAFSANPARSSRPRPIATSTMVRSSDSCPVWVIAGSSGLSFTPPSLAAIGSSRIDFMPSAFAIRFHSPTPSSPCASRTTTCRSRNRSWRST